MEGIAGVQARIDAIVGRFRAAPATGVLGGAPAGADDFAATLARAQTVATAGTSAAPAAAPAGSALNKAGVEPTRWAHDFLERLGMPVTSENVRAVVAWQRAEGTAARFNPLATTQGGFAGATKFNSVGVKNYATYDDGIAANIKAITNGRYENVLAALRHGDSAIAVARAIKDSPWGSGDLVLKILRQG
jgi:hypothetical protein